MIFKKLWVELVSLSKHCREVLRDTPRIKAVLAIGIFVFAINIVIAFLNEQHNAVQPIFNRISEALWHATVIFFEHFWIEILSAILIYIILEARIKKLFDIPQKYERRNHGEILDNFSNKVETHESIRILDTSIHTYIADNELFKKSLLTALENKDFKIEILLLHPDTYAAEQRSKDLSNKTRDILEKMKLGLAALHKCVREIKDKNPNANIQVKLFKSTPIMIFTSWDDKSNFGLLPSNDYADNNPTFLVRLKTDLGDYFTKYFENIWADAHSRDDLKTVPLDNYIYAKIDGIQLYWGGVSEDREKPKYVSSFNRVDDLNDLFDGKVRVLLSHDLRKNLVTLKSKLKGGKEQDSEYVFAKKQIEKTYGGPVKEIEGNPIYELEYNYDKFQIKLDNSDSIREKLIKNGYVFISHKHYDVQLSERTRDSFEALAFCMDHLTEVDKFDLRAIAEIKAIDPHYESNPRKRLFACFSCHLKGGICTITDIPESEYRRPFYLATETITSKTIAKREFKTLNSILEAPELQKPVSKEDEYKRLAVSKVLNTIKTTIESDLIYSLGEEEFISNEEKNYYVVTHLIRVEVGQNENKEAIEKQTFTTTKTLPLSTFEAIHLIDRQNVTGGVSHIFFKKKGIISKEQWDDNDYLLLEKPLDTLIYKKNLHKKKDKIEIYHATTQIELRKGQQRGYRDVLVIEFHKQ